jgi:hypothetical protein
MAGNRYTAQNTAVTLEDSLGTSITVGPGEGNMSIDPFNAENKEIVQKFDRGSHDGWVPTVDFTQAWSITIEMKNEAQTSATLSRMQDFLRHANSHATGGANALTSVSADVFALKAIVTMDDGTTTSTLTLPETVVQYGLAEGVEGHAITISGRNAVLPVWT